MFKRFALVTALIFLPICAWADMCDTAVQTNASKGLSAAIPYYESCALSDNDDVAEAVLGKAYASGENGVAKNMQKALLFYHLSAENGNAQSQTALAELLLKLDENKAGRDQVYAYLSKMHGAYQKAPSDTFKGDLLHPYTLLLLAAEKPEAKWYYPSNVTISPDAATLLSSYKITDAKKASALRDASVWKQRKMMQAAKELYSVADYEKFKNAVAPSAGKADAFTKSQAIAGLKKAVAEYKGN